MLFDAHFHLPPDADMPAMLTRFQDCHIAGGIVASATPDDWQRICTFAQKYIQFYGVLGIHPWVVFQLDDATLSALLSTLENHLIQNDIFGIGECGLDCTYPAIEKQIAIFDAQMKLACRHHKPVFIHVCKSWHLFQAYFKSHPFPEITVFHGFSCKEDIQKQMIKKGFYISIGRQMLRPNAPQLLPEIMNHTFIESDNDGMHLTDIRELAARYPNALISPERAHAVLKRWG